MSVDTCSAFRTEWVVGSPLQQAQQPEETPPAHPQDGGITESHDSCTASSDTEDDLNPETLKSPCLPSLPETSIAVPQPTSAQPAAASCGPVRDDDAHSLLASLKPYEGGDSSDEDVGSVEQTLCDLVVRPATPQTPASASCIASCISSPLRIDPKPETFLTITDHQPDQDAPCGVAYERIGVEEAIHMQPFQEPSDPRIGVPMSGKAADVRHIPQTPNTPLIAAVPVPSPTPPRKPSSTKKMSKLKDDRLQPSSARSKSKRRDGPILRDEGTCPLRSGSGSLLCTRSQTKAMRRKRGRDDPSDIWASFGLSSRVWTQKHFLRQDEVDMLLGLNVAWTPIVNSDGERDPSRFQHILKRSLATRVEELLSNRLLEHGLYEHPCITKAAMLKSVASGASQKFHTDLPANADARSGSILVALEPGAHIYILAQDGMTYIRLEFEPGDAVWFDAHVVHAGGSYAKTNIRLHAHVFEGQPGKDHASIYLLKAPTRHVRIVTIAAA